MSLLFNMLSKFGIVFFSKERLVIPFNLVRGFISSE